jgi:hypothetical protein
MRKIIKLSTIPKKSLILNGFSKVDYYDSYQISAKTEKSAEEISKELLQLTGWTIALLKLRNSIVKVFGLKTETNKKQDTFFMLIEKNEDEIVMGEADKHLDFRASVMKNRLENTISLTTVVHFNNIWGRIYFFPVRPFHKIIMKALLKRYLKNY